MRASLIALAALPVLSSASPLLASRQAGADQTKVDRLRGALLGSQRASWEQGAAAQALLEIDYPTFSVFTSNHFEVVGSTAAAVSGTNDGDWSFAGQNLPLQALQIASDAAVRQNDDGRLGVRLGGPVDGSAADPASMEPIVALGARIWPDESGRQFLQSASDRQLAYLLNTAPKDPQGAISHRTEQIAYWADSVFMTPPALAYVGALTSSADLLHNAFNQISVYRSKLRLSSGLWGHILSAHGWDDRGAWSTGNGWITLGALRVLASIRYSGVQGLDNEQGQLIAFVKEVLEQAFKAQTAGGLLPNYLDNASSFPEAAGTAALTASVYRLAVLSPSDAQGLLAAADKSRNAVLDAVNALGKVAPVVNALDWSAEGTSSPESEALALMMMAAYRDYQNAQ